MPEIDTVRTCRKCRAMVRWTGDAWMVVETETTADGLTYCPPNPDAARVGIHVPLKDS
jgi:hypothetical protein